jgi:ATP-dependent helicase/DNAse subunit B
MTTIDHKVAIYSYYFHRLLQRASDITILYNNSTTDGKAGEMSRFMLQMMVEDDKHQIHFNAIQTPASIVRSNPPVVKMEQKKQLGFLTPTAINTYMRCQLRYYYRYECGLQEPEEDMEETIDNRVFGNIFHEASQRIYERMLSRSHQILKSDIEELLKNDSEIERVIDEAIQKEMKVTSLDPKMLNGLQIINRQVLIHYLRQLLQIDHELAPFSIIGLETDVRSTLQTPHIKTIVGGRIDRLDRIVKDGVKRIRVIDYKTGGSKLKPLADVDAIFKQESMANHSDYYLQTFVYADIVRRNTQQAVSPALLYIQHAGKDNYDPTLAIGKVPVTDIAEHSERFSELLEQKVSEILSPETAFCPTDDQKTCEKCPYRSMCRH